MRIREITEYLEELAPLSYQESYDNCGLLCGDPSAEAQGILCTLDATEEVVAEAEAAGCNLIVAHHPILFRGLKKLNGKNYVERTLIRAIKKDVAIYAIHTNLDHVRQGVNAKIAERLGLRDGAVLLPKKGILRRLDTFVPPAQLETLRTALARAGAGQIGNYSACGFAWEGRGSFLPGEGAKPHVGRVGHREEVAESALSMIFPAHLSARVEAALRETHPYEMPAYYIQPLDNASPEVGAGMVGRLPETMSAATFLAHVKEGMKTDCIRHTAPPKKAIEKVAVCGGAGSFLLKEAIRQGADAFVSADFKYHEFFDAEGKILVADIGHYESEAFTKDLLQSRIKERFPKIPLRRSEVATNPIRYFH